MKSKLRKIGKFLHQLCRVCPIGAAFVISFALGTGSSLLPAGNPQMAAGWVFVGMSWLLGCVWVYRMIRKTLSVWQNGALLWGMGTFLRLGYILRAPYYYFQHDAERFSLNRGHTDYIRYLWQEGHLPDFDVRERWQFYHPPLHYILSAVWMKLMELTGISEAALYESVQVLPFVYSCTALAVFGMLLKHFHLKGIAFSLPMGIMALHPAFLILSGSINNDMLSILCMLVTLLLALRWYNKPKFSTITALGFSVGLGMLAKLSAWMAAPAVAVLFLTVLKQNRQQLRSLLKQYTLFGCISLPLGLGWGLRNFVKWGVPLTYIPALEESSGQYVGAIPVWQRLLDFSPEQFRYIYDCFTTDGQTYNEYNPLIGLLKTAVFDEFVNTDYYPRIAGLGDLLFWAQVILAGTALFAMVRECCRTFTAEKQALLLTYLVTLISYTGFCLAYPQVCTENARYATPLIYVTLLFLGMWMKRLGEKAFVRKLLGAADGVFMAISFTIYGLVIFG